MWSSSAEGLVREKMTLPLDHKTRAAVCQGQGSLLPFHNHNLLALADSKVFCLELGPFLAVNIVLKAKIRDSHRKKNASGLRSLTENLFGCICHLGTASSVASSVATVDDRRKMEARYTDVGRLVRAFSTETVIGNPHVHTYQNRRGATQTGELLRRRIFHRHVVRNLKGALPTGQGRLTFFPSGLGI